jgi:hypothetical protein
LDQLDSLVGGHLPLVSVVDAEAAAGVRIEPASDDTWP